MKWRNDYAISKEQFNNLPEDVKEKCRNILTAYDTVYISFEYGQYKVSTAIVICASYAPDHKFIGAVLAEDIFTED